jgi:pyruvate dehydrogenase E1 component alpha subunit
VLGQGGTLGSCFPLATGVALAYQLQSLPAVAVAFFGDGAAARGTFLESAVVATARDLPVIYVCENNGYAVSATVEESQGCVSLLARAEGFGLPGVSLDGSDVVAVFEAAEICIARARTGGGPSFIEAVTTRGSGHYVGDLEPYRDRQALRSPDPIALAEQRLRDLGVTQQDLNCVRDEAQEEMEAALEEALCAPKPDRDRLFEGIWA